ncbi:bifunctional 2-polyprenyl-6-hydroxyphenol methylase/3-demethylubiquinol 3-O-methyltransferase UbiG [Endozoicomonas sp. SM1973]|uniref:Ubiquinone biosynthesis O-methyltransferase n=1 Tax=Spartinivicinus marinus TaxID=2994442 RepID=A0A853IBZ7_9GAMM|nr:bifunctional 2-polyprenyl-6-hydroxyphenol methylase/3-demethylubiquinol 3-O-methyltransferase UbiG [Spartinivicinus marinus]MCX4028781.1 bifunctional 2-polyprenyl-6-hydroxyphenol methylase/3-demethylubiquinol 3-O-methyltransferase UbiG [Spartinivicinus marinus]NYZ67594.1 bifunctional 2-polyprenyl-6-hydroxyphenol methylase/3-demethylubiquinol 3-O-methyltransferase UbiG [Spartinivicinus marinus]
MATEHTNVDPQEIAKFEALAHRWWDKSSEFKPLHDINPLRLSFIEQFVNLAEQKVVDIGCGGGILSEAMALRGAQVTGIDMGEEPLTVAKLHGLESGVKVDYQQITAEGLAAQQPDTFDIVTCMEMLEHVPHPISVIEACSQLVKPGGHLFFSTINRNPKAYALAVIGAEYILKMLPKGTHDYDKFIKPSELAGWARQCGLTVSHIKGMAYNPITKVFKLSDDVDVNYLVHVTKDQH